MKILLIFPTIFEADAFFKKSRYRAFLGACAQLDIGSVGIHAIVSGIGCEASAKRVRAFAEEIKPDIAILCGFCGACLESAKESDILFETKNGKLSSVFTELGFCEGKIACVKQVAGFEQKTELASRGFAGVEMESGFFSGFFKAENFAHVRIVSDGVRSKIPAEFFDSMLDRTTGASSFSPKKFFGMALKSPALPVNLALFAVKAGKVKKIYDAAVMRMIEKISQIYLPSRGENEIL